MSTHARLDWGIQAHAAQRERVWLLASGDAHSTPGADGDVPETWVSAFLFAPLLAGMCSGLSYWTPQVDHLQARLRRAPVAGPIEMHNYAAPGASVREDLPGQVARFVEEITYVPTPQGPAPAIHPNKGTYGESGLGRCPGGCIS